MKSKILWGVGLLAALVLLLFLLCNPFATSAPPESTEPSEPVETESQETQAQETQTQETQPEHSELYFPGLSVDDVILYFNEVCLDSEFVNGGDPTVIQKWAAPIYYRISGEYTNKDLSVLNDFVIWLNTIDGFPGIFEATDANPVNLRIYFCNEKNLLNIMGPNFKDLDGAVTFWYDDNIIYDATICYRTEIAQYTRNSVILEEIYNGLGPIQDTTLRPDSIIYQSFSEPQALTDIDELILRLLYHRDILPGMTAEQCEQVIRQLYY